MNGNEDLRLQTTDRQILKLAGPIGFALLVPQFNYLVNSLFLSALGPGHLGAAGITGVYYLIFAAIGYGLNNGLQALVARRAGQDRIGEIGVLSVQSLYASLGVAAAGVLATYRLAPLLLEDAIDPTLYGQSMSFLRIRIWGLPFLYVYQMRNGLLVGTNQSRLLFWGTLSETVSNVLLDYGLIFGHFGLPALGFNGAAYASVAAEGIGMATVLAIIHRKGLTERFGLFRDLRPRWPEMRLLLGQSAPLVAQFAISIISWEYFFILVSRLGRTALDLSQYMRVIIGFLGVFIWSFASTTSTMVSNVIGQGRRDEVMPLVGRILRLSLGVSLALSLPLELFPGGFLRFVRDDPDFIRQGIPVVRVVAAAMVLMSVSTIWLNAVTGTGNTRVNLAIEALTVVVYAVYVYQVLVVRRWPLHIAWMSEWVYWTCTFLLSRLYLRSGRWRAREI